MVKFRHLLLAATAASAFATTAAWADPMLNPQATIVLTKGSKTFDFLVDGTTTKPNPFAAAGGAGTVFQSAKVTGSSNFQSDMVVDITGFSGVGTTGIGSTWQLFAVIDLNSTGTSSGGDFTSTGLSGDIQIYAVNDAMSAGLAQFADPSAANVKIDSTTSATATKLGKFGISGLPGVDGSKACVDQADVNNAGSADCILVANGTVTDGDVTLSSDTETFSVLATITPESYADAFFDGDTAELDLTIDSGASGETAIDVTDPKTVYATDGGQPVNWQLTAVPEPASFTLFGMGLLGFAALRRRRRA